MRPTGMVSRCAGGSAAYPAGVVSADRPGDSQPPHTSVAASAIATAARSRIGSGPNSTALCARCQGNVQKIGRSLAFAHRPELQVLDEPTFGLEAPVARVTAAARRAPVDSGGVADVPLDTQERRDLCDCLDELGPSVPTLLEGWTAHDLAAHLVLRERDLVAGPCLVLPGFFQRLAERRRVRLAERKDFTWLVARMRFGPPIGFLRVGWVRSLANLNEFFVHHEDVRRANGRGPRTLTPEMDAAVWRNVRRSGHYLSRRLHACGLDIEWAGTDERVTVPGEPTARLSGAPGELLLYVFGRQAAAQVEVSGPPEAVAAVRRTHFGM